MLYIIPFGIDLQLQKGHHLKRPSEGHRRAVLAVIDAAVDACQLYRLSVDRDTGDGEIGKGALSVIVAGGYRDLSADDDGSAGCRQELDRAVESAALEGCGRDIFVSRRVSEGIFR